MSDMYNDWGFVENPFQTTPLEADEAGRTLLIGREKELRKIQNRLKTYPKMPCLEGANGVGKTSLVNVAAYNCFKNYIDGTDSTLIIPCRRAFQLTPNMNLDDFEFNVLYEVAQTLIERGAYIKDVGIRMDGKASLDRWLNSPFYASWQGTLSAFSIGGGQAPNESSGFSKSGLRKIVEGWLSAIFPQASDGALICLIDNLELLQTSDEAKQAIEQLRDRLFNIPGLRWVLCGANGIILSLASSPRLEGYVSTPVIDVPNVEENFAPEIFDSRVKAFRYPPSSIGGKQPEFYLPITKERFEKLYEVLNFNLRNLLNRADSYSTWIIDEGVKPSSDEEKNAFFDQWLSMEANSVLQAVQGQITPAAWRVFEKAVELGGRFSPGQHQEFGYDTPQALRPNVLQLEKVDLLSSARDDTDQRRKTVYVTSKGHLARYARTLKP
ncbi:MAG: hypothetical protein J0L85_10610 [Zoogloea sp.]|nr:hypothetical protein [Zoogloea sp.]MCA0184846.1 hypothetical protein [Pseudomonadota bacterium]